MTVKSNLLADLPTDLPDELITVLVQSPGLRVERIISRGHASPEGFWYDQDQHEWVVLLQGAARLHFESDSAPIELKPGDCVNIPAHTRQSAHTHPEPR